MSPNWFLNMSSPILEVPITQFFFSVLIGETESIVLSFLLARIISKVESCSHLFDKQFNNVMWLLVKWYLDVS